MHIGRRIGIPMGGGGAAIAGTVYMGAPARLRVAGLQASLPLVAAGAPARLRIAGLQAFVNPSPAAASLRIVGQYAVVPPVLGSPAAIRITGYAPVVLPAPGGAGATFVTSYTATTDGAGAVTYANVSMGTGTSNKRVALVVTNNATLVTIAGVTADHDSVALSNANLYSAVISTTSSSVSITGSGGSTLITIGVYELLGSTGAPSFIDRTTNSGSTITVSCSPSQALICGEWADTSRLPVTWTGATKGDDLNAGSGYYFPCASVMATATASLVVGCSNNFDVAGGAAWRYSLG